MANEPTSEDHPAARLRAGLAGAALLEAPCVYDALSARLAEQAGFDAVVLGAGATANFLYGLPDIGLLSLPEIIGNVERVARAVGIPVIADLDDAGGSPMHIRRHVQMAERAGAAALMLEDCDMSGKHLWSDTHGGWDFTTDKLLPVGVAVDAVKAAVDARIDERTIILARTNAYQPHGLEATLERANLYVEAGAELIFLAHMPYTEMSREVFDAIPAPVMHAEFESPSLPERNELGAAGLKLLAYALQAITGAFHGFREALEDIKAGRRAADARTEWDRNRPLLEAVGLKEWSEVLRGGAAT